MFKPYEEYVRLTIKLASRAVGRTSPNPLVGAVIVKNGQIVGQGYHRRVGAPHAEINALAEAGNKAIGADLYLNLEPCSHYGRTPPCVDAIIQGKIKRVFVGMQDPNPLVNGKGIKKLREAGILVKTGILEEKCRKLNEVFIKYITTGRPFVILKAAVTLDGRIAAVGGNSKWITNEKSRQYVHRLRNQVDGVLVGIRTIQKDDPMLTTRLKSRSSKDPVRIVVDSTLKISLRARVFNPRSKSMTIIATTPKSSQKKIQSIENQGGKVVVIPSRNRVGFNLLMEALGKEEITSVLIEGGSQINTSALQEGIVDKVVLFYAPRIMGGKEAPLIVGGEGVSKVEDAFLLHRIRTRRFGDDVMIEGYIKKRSQ
ncbi:MAG: bifunctional diaminohydroxyphosphoribosylaminopyrimidine deaminase/5-amino-6-(5-phosphoribosylamino)uracil reductase RibD [Deltaproteobacteria bacterium]|nr:bifunctional diaminohydroxyphosphoribosylaminopyrimidine deaminase/5-amino-6-(5-phosphoribosylamino)uracil reductase RibD [Deltaproteobacteria bacterium]